MDVNSEYYFSPSTLDEARKEGISAIMRIKNGEEFLRLSIESHIHYYDEIIACYNGCTDRTQEILEDLQRTHPDKLKIYHYEPYVHPPYGEEHDQTPTNSVHALANYYNYALSKASFSVVTKLDDDHIALDEPLTVAINKIREDLKNGVERFYTFSGVNLIRNPQGIIGIKKSVPLVGTGDHFYFPVRSDIYFEQTKKFEALAFKGRRPIKEYLGVLYFHLKYLKSDMGFGNWDERSQPSQAFFDSLAEDFITLEDFLSDAHLRKMESEFNCLEYRVRTHPAVEKLVFKLLKKNTPLRLARQKRLKQNLQGVNLSETAKLIESGVLR